MLLIRLNIDSHVKQLSKELRICITYLFRNSKDRLNYGFYINDLFVHTAHFIEKLKEFFIVDSKQRFKGLAILHQTL
jgi:hypothetical protein